MTGGKSTSQWQPGEAVETRFAPHVRFATAPAWLSAHWPGALVTLAAVVLRVLRGGWFGADVSWLLTLAQSTLNGHAPYRVFFEVNPPGSILLYLPAVAIGHAMGLSPEIVLNGLLIVAGALSAMLCAGMVGRTGVLTARQVPLFEAAVMFVLLIAPFSDFGQREHIATIVLLPLISLYALRMAGERPAFPMQVLAGLAAGIGVAIKPHFALALALPFAFLIFSRPMALRARVRLAVMPEHVLAFAVCLAYLLVAIFGFPDYFHIALPRALRIYEPVFVRPKGMVVGLALLGVETALMAALVRRAVLARVPAIFGLAAAGFALAMVLQFKGWPYHSLPAFLLLNITFALTLIPRAGDVWAAAKRPANRLVAVMLAILGIGVAWRQAQFAMVDDDVVPALLPALARIAPPHPKMMAISKGSIGFPLVRQLDGKWVGPTANAWVPNYAYYLLAKHPAAATRRAIEGDARWYWQTSAADIRNRRPDVILIEGLDLEKTVLSQPQLAGAMRLYRKAEMVSGISVWIPRDAHGAPAATVKGG